MADSTLDIKKLNLKSEEFTSVDLFDALEDDDESVDPAPKDKKTPPAPKKKEKVEDTEKTTEEDEFDIPPPGLRDIFGDEEGDEDEEEELPTPKSKTPAPAPEAPTEDEEEEDEEDSKGIFNVYARELVNLGIFVPEDDEDDMTFETPQDFADRWEYEFKKASRNEIHRYLQSKGNDALDWFDAVFNKGVSPKEYMQQFDSVESIINLNMEHESNQERVVRDLLKQQGFEPEDIDAEVTKLRNIGELESTSQRYHKTLVKRESAKLQEMKDKAAEEERQKTSEREQFRVTLTQLLNTKVKAKDFDGIPVTPNVANEVFDSLYNYKYTSPKGEYLTQFDKDLEDLKRNPEMKLKVGLLLNMLKKDPTMAALKKKAISSESNGLFQDLAQKKKTLIKKQTPAETLNHFGV